MTLKARTGTQSDSSISLTENAIYILKKRYLKRGKQGNVIETPEKMFHRVARTIASAEIIYDTRANIDAWENRFYQLMANLEFIPSSSTLLNAGRKPGQLSACFSIPIDDSVESIFEAIKNSALIHKSGGGTGFSFSRLRPEGDMVGSVRKVASGPVSFIRVFSSATGAISQGGIRQGCNMATLSVEHPDIMKFITAKDDPDTLSNFYLSVAVTTEFMEAVKVGANYSLINPRAKRVVGKLNAREVLDRMVEQTWKTGDPGIVFSDRIEQDNLTPQLGNLEILCGCGEQILLPYESSNLGSINLARMVRYYNGTGEVDYSKLGETIKISVRFLDNVIDVSKFPLPEIEEMTRKTRKIGLGVMGFADMLMQLGIPYDTEEAVATAGNVMQFINKEAHKTSAALAEERGVYPAFTSRFYNSAGSFPQRNASCTTVAPTGTISIIAGCSSGIEPYYGLVFVRNVFDGDNLLEVNPFIERVAESEGFYSDELMKNLACGSELSHLENVPDKIKRLFVTTMRVKPEWHVRIQSSFQKHTDNAVAKTVNLPHEATREDITKIYMMAYEQGLKGITIYRNGSRKLQPLYTNQTGLELMCRRLSTKTNILT